VTDRAGKRDRSADNANTTPVNSRAFYATLVPAHKDKHA
jgi:hypothetical protein